MNMCPSRRLEYARQQMEAALQRHDQEFRRAVKLMDTEDQRKQFVETQVWWCGLGARGKPMQRPGATGSDQTLFCEIFTGNLLFSFLVQIYDFFGFVSGNVLCFCSSSSSRFFTGSFKACSTRCYLGDVFFFFFFFFKDSETFGT
jgi:hypothetical protein